MAFPNVIVIALALALPDGAILQSTPSDSDTDRSDQVVQIECTTVSLKYVSGSNTKRTHSENCSNSTGAIQSDDLADHENLSNTVIDEE